MENRGYARPGLLAETDWLAQHLDDPAICIVEIGTKADTFAEGHIPGAINREDWRLKSAANPAMVVTPSEAKALFESLGIGDDSVVIAYDRTHNRDAARLWWVLTYYGHSNVKILNGGWEKWTQEDRRVETGQSKTVGKAAPTFTPAARPEMLTTLDSLNDAIGQHNTIIWDTRTKEEFVGENDRGNKRKGHVPGARHLEWIDLINQSDSTFKSAEEIRRLTTGIGITPDTQVHAY